MSTLADRQKAIINMPLIVFDSYLTNLTKEGYKEYLDISKIASTDKRNTGMHAEGIIKSMITGFPNKDDFSLKLMSLAYTFNQPDYFKELVDAEIPKEEIAYTFQTTVENVSCQMLLNQKAKELEQAETYKYTK